MEAPRRMKFEDHRSVASEVGEESGEFYSVAAERIPLKFSAQRTGFTAALEPSARTHSQTASPTGHSQKFWKRSHGSKPDKDFV